MKNVDPFAWLSLTLQRVANGWPSGEATRTARSSELSPLVWLNKQVRQGNA